MTSRHLLLALFSLLLVAANLYADWMQFQPRGFPYNGVRVGEQTLELHAFPGVPLPPGVQEGDRVDVLKQSAQSRLALVIPKLPIGYSVDAVVDRGSQSFTVPFTVVDGRGIPIPGQPDRRWYSVPQIVGTALLCAIALLLLWRGRDRAAAAMALWAVTFDLSYILGNVPVGGWWGYAVFNLGVLCFLTARVGLYLMVEAKVAAALSPLRHRVYRVLFWTLLALGAVYAMGGPLLVVFTGSGVISKPELGLVLTASYFVPVAMLIDAYRRAALEEKLRLRWMLTSGVLWALGVLLQNTPVLGFASGIASYFLLSSALLGFLYAVLKLRVVDIAVVIDRALVYGLVTTLVVGVIAAVNSLALREVLTPGASLLLQLVVPLALGIVLGRVRSFMDRFVEQVFFRGKYLAEQALRSFAQHAGHMQDVGSLLDGAMREIQRNLGAPALAIYSVEEKGYQRLRQAGKGRFPARLDPDDPALVAARAEQRARDLAGGDSALGQDGCVFPMLVLGTLRGVIVCANRPGEHYAEDEKRLMEQVARDVGAAWRILRARDNEAYVRAMAGGELTLKAARDKARALSLTWTRG